MTGVLDGNVFDQAMAEIRRRSKLKLYQTDFDAWAWDILKLRNYQKMREIAFDSLFADKERTLTKSANGVGKLLSADTPVPTPDGWTRYGDLKTGDTVLDELGQSTAVLGRTQVWENENFYRVTFDDGTYLDAGEHHEWLVFDERRRRKILGRSGNPSALTDDFREEWDRLITVETGEMAATPYLPSGRTRWRVPLSQPLDFPEAVLPIDPYMLGFWLADGSTDTGRVSYGVTKHAVMKHLLPDYVPISDNGTVTIPGLQVALREAGLLGNKHIPMGYLRASEAQRRSLLAGILDGDGFIAGGGGAVVGVDLTHKPLFEGVVALVRSLGHKVFVSEGEAAYTKDGSRHVTGVRYRANWRPQTNPFRCRVVPFREPAILQRSRHTQRTVISVEYIGTESGSCIEVGSLRHLYLAGEGLIATHNSALMAQMILWAGSVFPVGDTVQIISAPSIPQLQKVTFTYLKNYHGRVNTELRPKDFQIPGRIDENLGWVSDGPKGKVWLASGRKPPDQDAVSMFQGLRSQFGMTYVWFDEAGGMSKGMFTAAEAVQTGDDSRFSGIGNPDNAGAEWQASFDDPEKAQEYNLHTISAFDTPVFTGERVYPHNSEGDVMEKQLLKALTSKRWVAHKSRIWASGGVIIPDVDRPMDRRYNRRVDKTEKVLNPETGKKELVVTDPMRWDARGLSKVLGQFPGDNDSAFFPTSMVNAARDKDIPEDLNIRPVMGVDIARFGSDESVMFSNRGGRCRVLDSWGKSSTVESARRVHQNAMSVNAKEVRIDASGVGGGVYDMLKELAEFSGKCYDLIGVDGGRQSSDPRRWANSRAENHEQLRTLMAGDGEISEIDIDYDDKEVKEQLTNVTFRFAKVSGAIQITPKDEMKTEMDGSPDRLDALIYATLDSSLLYTPESPYKPGDVILQDPWEIARGAWWQNDDGGLLML